jgi:hypothetical protein
VSEIHALTPIFLVLIGGTSFLERGSDDTGVVHGVVAALRLQGRTMAIPWLSGFASYSSLSKRVEPFMRYAKERFVQRIHDGNPAGGKDFLWHLVSFHSPVSLVSCLLLSLPSMLTEHGGAE